MNAPQNDRWLLALLLAATSPLFFIGLSWGLPSHAVDPYLFGDEPVWSGREILQRAPEPEDDPERGSDVASHPLERRNMVVLLNGNDASRAQIIRRYRLFSYQPDEWNTLRALSRMKPGRMDLDPRLYQYGGLWVYPVGVLLKIASVLHVVQLRSDVAFYLDHPEMFGRFYVVARSYSAVWGLVGVAAVFLLVRTITGGRLAPATAALCFALMPVVVNGAHEAKPHLAGAGLMLLAVLVGARYAETGARGAWWAMASLCGAAAAMVLSAAPVFVILPMATLLRNMSWRQRLTTTVRACLLGAAVYLICNPYVPINLIFNRAVLFSNLGTTAGMYRADRSASTFAHAAYLAGLGASYPLLAAGTAGALLLGLRAVRNRNETGTLAVQRRAAGLLLAGPALAMLIQFTLMSAHKPAEHARFAVFPDTFLMVEAVVAVQTFVPSTRGRWLGMAALLLGAALFGLFYVRAFARDSRVVTPRLMIARQLQELSHRGSSTLEVSAEPAPYVLPPVDLFRWKILLLPPGRPAALLPQNADVAVYAVDVPQDQRGGWLDRLWLTIESAPVAWANKGFEVRTRLP